MCWANTTGTAVSVLDSMAPTSKCLFHDYLGVKTFVKEKLWWRGKIKQFLDNQGSMIRE